MSMIFEHDSDTLLYTIKLRNSIEKYIQDKKSFLETTNRFHHF